MSFKNLHAWHFIAISVKQQCHQYLLIIRTLDWCNNHSCGHSFVKPLYHQLCSKHIQRILRTLSIVGKDNSQFVGDLPWFTYIILLYIYRDIIIIYYIVTLRYTENIWQQGFPIARFDDRSSAQAARPEIPQLRINLLRPNSLGKVGGNRLAMASPFHPMFHPILSHHFP